MKKIERRINKFDYARLQTLKAAVSKEEDYYLSDLLRRVKPSLVLDHASTPPHLVTMNSCIVVQNLKTKERIEFTLVFPEDADAAQNKISVLEPMGAAVLGYGVGETVQFASPAGSVWLKIERVAYQPESAGNYAV